MIVYASFSVDLHGLSMTDAQIEELRAKLEAAVREHVYPDAEFDGDIKVELMESAGSGMVWVYDGYPGTSGWYSILYSWDAHEGVHVGAAQWDGPDWTAALPIVGFAGPHKTEEAAKAWAVENDPDH